MICENGRVRRESTPFSDKQVCYDIDPDFLLRERAKNDAFAPRRDIVFRFGGARSKKTNILRDYSPLPFVPEDKAERARRCREILDMQSAGLKQRLLHTRTKRCVIGISGGLDSTLALLVTARTYAELGMPSSDILCVTMPCFGTTAADQERTPSILCERAGRVAARTVAIRRCGAACTCATSSTRRIRARRRHMKTRRRGSARRYLMDIGQRRRCGMVVGTGDLSELALGWATYNGDHMSMYGVNASRAENTGTAISSPTCARAESTPDAARGARWTSSPRRSVPELLPARKRQHQRRKTEDLVGPYELHDFFLYQVLRVRLMPPAKAASAAAVVGISGGVFPSRMCMLRVARRPSSGASSRSSSSGRACRTGPRSGRSGVSPRGDLCLPSDASNELWLREIEELKR